MVAMIFFNSVILRSPDIHAIIKEQQLSHDNRKKPPL